MKVMILTAGKGKRLLPLSKKLPKPLFPVGDRPVLYYLLDLIREYGGKEVVLNLYHLGDLIEKELGNGEQLGFKIAYSREAKLLGTGGGIKQAQGLLGKEDILVINGDNLLELNLEKFSQYHRAQKAIATMLLKPGLKNPGYTPIYLSETGLVKSIGGKQKGPAYSFLGTQILTSRFIRRLPQSGPAGLIKDGYRKVLRGRPGVAAYITTGYWREISTLSLYWEANLDFLRGKSPAYFYRGREEFTRRGIHAGKNCSLGPRISFYYPVYIGNDCQIGGNTRLGPAALVGSGSKIGENCRLENVLVWPGSKIRKGSKLDNLIVTPFGKFSLVG